MKAIKTKYIGPTNFKGCRIKASDGDGNHITVGYKSELSIDANHAQAAQALCDKLGWPPYSSMYWYGHEAFHVRNKE